MTTACSAKTPSPAEWLPARAKAPPHTILATVNGTPVTTDCVVPLMTAQSPQQESAVTKPAASTKNEVPGLTSQQALDRCIDFALLAENAMQKGLDTHPDVLRTAKTEMVRQLIDQYFAKPTSDPNNIDKAIYQEVYDQIQKRSHGAYFRHPEYRQTFYVRVPVASPKEDTKTKNNSKTKPVEAASLPVINSKADFLARKLAWKIYNAAKDSQPTTKEDLGALAKQIAGEKPVEAEFIERPRSITGLVSSYANTAFALQKTGQISKPVKTPWGWDIILLTQIIPARDDSASDPAAIKELYDSTPVHSGARIEAYHRWYKEIFTNLNLPIARDDTLLATMTITEQTEESKLRKDPTAPPQ